MQLLLFPDSHHLSQQPAADKLPICSGAALSITTELPVPTVETQLNGAKSRTSVPVITITRSSESRSIPTTTTIRLQPSSVQSSVAQHHGQRSVSTLSEPSLSSRKLTHSNGQVKVLKSKNGRPNGSSHASLSKSPCHHAATGDKPSQIVREVQNGQRPEPSIDSRFQANSAKESRSVGAAPLRANSPPPDQAAASSTVCCGVTGREEDSKAMQAEGQPQVQASPFEAEAAQSLSRESLESHRSKSDSDKMVESAGDLGFLLLPCGCCSLKVVLYTLHFAACVCEGAVSASCFISHLF